MLKGVRKIIIAFSGGVDSVCLLNVFHSLFRNKIELSLMYVNHGLRPQKILEKEENLTKFYALKYGMQCKIARVKVPSSKEGVEAAARDVRYAALLKYMQDTGSDCIATGHHRGDVIETFFLNIIRGSGASGLTSLQPVRKPYIRPCINLTKKVIHKYVQARKLPYNEDETNEQLTFRRNLLRHKVIPELLKINPELHEVIQRQIELLHIDNTYLEEKAGELYKHTTQKKGDIVLLDMKKLLRYNPALVSRVVRQSIKDLNGGLEGFESKHIAAILSLNGKESGKRIDLPKKLYAQREFDNVVIGRIGRTSHKIIRIDPRKDRVDLGKQVVKVRTVSQFDLKERRQGCEVFDIKKLQLPLVFRARQRGDILVTRSGKKVLKKLYSEHKIPPRDRHDLMMLCDQKGILMIPGIARAYRAYIDDSTKRILVVDCEHLT